MLEQRMRENDSSKSVANKIGAYIARKSRSGAITEPALTAKGEIDRLRGMI